MKTRLTTLALSLSVLGVAACGTEADPTEVHARIERTVPGIVDGAAALADQVPPDDLAALPGGADALAGLLDAGSLPAAGQPSAKADQRARVAAQLAALISAQGTHLRARAADGDAPSGADVAKELNESLFTQANYAGDGVYRLPAEELCGTDENGVTDADCVAQVKALKPSLRVETDGDDGLDMTLVIGEIEPAAIHLEPLHANLSVDLGDVAKAINAARTLLDLPSELDGSWSMRGVVSADLQVATGVGTFAVNIDEAIHASVVGAGVTLDSAQAFNLDIDKSQPLFRLQLDAGNKALRGGIALGATKIHVPATENDPSFDLDLPGPSLSWNQTVGQDLLLGLTLGNRTTTLKVDGKQAVGIDLNATKERKVDITVATEADTGAATFEFFPSLDLQLAIDSAALGGEAPRFVVTRVKADAAMGKGPAIRVSSRASDGESQLEVVGGAVAIETNPAEFGVSLAAGQCLGAAERTDADGTFEAPAIVACE